MRILDIAITVALVGFEVGVIEVSKPADTTQCQPEEICYPIDPRDPKQDIPPNCVVDEEGGLVCNPIDQSDKFK